MSETVLRRRVAGQNVTTRRRLERQIAKAQTSFRHKEKREARRFSRTAQKPFFSLLLTTLQALAGACGRRWKSPLTIPLIAGYPSGVLSDSATPGPASNGGIRSVRAPPTGLDLARHTDSHPCRAHGAAGASSQPEPRGQVLQLDFHRLGRGVSGPHVLVDRVHARHEAS
jgi:hypothetical protein